MVVVTGPTGSGKTTTLYAALSEIATPEDKIITIEDPVEYQIPLITQVPVNEKKGLSLRARAALDPAPRPGQDHGGRGARPGDGADRRAVRAHRPPRVHHRPRQQRVRRHRPLHRHGRRALQLRLRPQLRHGPAAGAPALRALQAAGRPADTLLRESGLDPEVYHDQVFYEPVGCDECGGTGFLGRTAVDELLDMTDRIRQLILERRPTGEIKQVAREEGMTFLRDSALEKVFAGLTTLREINKVTFVAEGRSGALRYENGAVSSIGRQTSSPVTRSSGASERLFRTNSTLSIALALALAPRECAHVSCITPDRAPAGALGGEDDERAARARRDGGRVLP
jgi:type IV pilus assembly protein PilB